ncbi:MAG: sugar ABC transporter substrate-binding protein [Eubacteriales bacterium]|nr:sugar ABC transporter substrate-binding protein [Eubacteriales bacterium]
MKMKKKVLAAAFMAASMMLGITAQAEEKPYEGVELNFLRHSGYDADWMAEKAEDFYEETGIRVNIEQVAYSDSHNKFVVDASSAGGTYDIYATTEYWLPEFYEGGWIIDLQQFVDDPALMNEAYNIEDIPESMLELNRIDGKLLAIPWKFNSQMLVYNTNMVQQAPASWEELLEEAKRQTEAGNMGMTLALSKASAMDIYLNLLYQNGGTFLSEDLKTCYLDTEEAKEALEFLVALSAYASDGSVNNQWPETATLFSQGNVAMAYTVNTQMGNILDPEKSEVIACTAVAEQPGPVTACATSSTWGLCITKNCENPEAAFLFIEYITEAENMRELVEQTGGSTNPVRTSLLNDEKLVGEYPWFSVMSDISSQDGHTFAYPKTTQCTSIMEILAGHVQEAVNGTESVEEALDNAKTEIEALL